MLHEKIAAATKSFIEDDEDSKLIAQYLQEKQANMGAEELEEKMYFSQDDIDLITAVDDEVYAALTGATPLKNRKQS